LKRRTRKQIQAATMKVNSRSIMGAIPKSTSHPLDLLDLGIDGFSQCIGDAMSGIGNDILHMNLQGFGRFLDGLQMRMPGPEIPPLEIATHRTLVPVIPQMPQILLNRPGPADFQIPRPQRLKLLLTPRRDILFTPQPQILGPFQQRLSTDHKLAMLILAHCYLPRCGDGME